MNLPTEYQSFIHLSRYARWRYDEERREKDSFVQRNITFMMKEQGPKIKRGQRLAALI